MIAKVLAAALVLTGAVSQAQLLAAQPAAQPDVTIPSITNALEYSSGIPADQKSAMAEAVSTLGVLPLDMSKPEVQAMAKMMGTQDVSAQAMQAWMEARVKYIIEGDFDLNAHAGFSTAPFTYENPNDLPDALAHQSPAPAFLRRTADQAQNDKCKDQADAASRRQGGQAAQDPNQPSNGDKNDCQPKAEVVMLNIGTAIYAFGKQNKRLVVMDIPGVGQVALTSPRTGLLEIGPGLFPDLGGHKVQNIALDIFRLGTLFHEARHSDGHAHTLGFMHSNCPAGHDYAGLAACDVAANGPYSIGASVMKSLMVKCNDSATCTPVSAQLLQAIYADQADRTITAAQAGGNLSPDAGAGMDWNDAPEGQR